MNNREFTKHAPFIKACKAADIKPTVRQASKFRMGRGLAYKQGRKNHE